MLSSGNTSDKVTIKPQTRACSLFRSLKKYKQGGGKSRREWSLLLDVSFPHLALCMGCHEAEKPLSSSSSHRGRPLRRPPSPSQSSQAPSPFARSRKLLLSVGPLLEGGEGRGTFLPPPVIEDESVEGGSLPPRHFPAVESEGA